MRSKAQVSPGAADIIRLPSSASPMLIVVVDTEEEFDWNLPLDRRAIAVTAMRHVHRTQDLFDEFRIQPCYVVDYPVASTPEGYGVLKQMHRDGRAVVGAHLHPWVTPPFDEEVGPRNSFPGNLDPALEEAKLRVLSDRIEEAFGERPTLYKAGRYGFGPNTADILERNGFRADLSPAPGYDYSEQAGPDFTACTNHAFRLGPNRRLVCLPCTGAFVGGLATLGANVSAVANSTVGTKLRIGGVLSRLRLLERIRLSPEGHSLDEMVRLTRFLLERGVRIFTLSFHSPSLVPGCTPYVRSADDLKGFLDRIRRYLVHFSSVIGGQFPRPLELVSQLLHSDSEQLDHLVRPR
jgi:hypothetical protein